MLSCGHLQAKLTRTAQGVRHCTSMASTCPTSLYSTTVSVLLSHAASCIPFTELITRQAHEAKVAARAVIYQRQIHCSTLGSHASRSNPLAREQMIIWYPIRWNAWMLSKRTPHRQTCI